MAGERNAAPRDGMNDQHGLAGPSGQAGLSVLEIAAAYELDEVRGRGGLSGPARLARVMGWSGVRELTGLGVPGVVRNEARGLGGSRRLTRVTGPGVLGGLAGLTDLSVPGGLAQPIVLGGPSRPAMAMGLGVLGGPVGVSDLSVPGGLA